MVAMARGWESKSVEAQQAEAIDKSAEPRVKLSPHAAAMNRERERLRLTRQQVLQQLQASQNDRHRSMLQDALADLDQESAWLRSLLENVCLKGLPRRGRPLVHQAKVLVRPCHV